MTVSFASSSRQHWPDYNCADVVTALVEAGADVNATDNGRTALMAAAANDELSFKFLKILVGAGADVKATDTFGVSTFHFLTCADWTQFESCEYLMEHGADIDAIDSEGRTPLMFFLGFILTGSVEEGFLSYDPLPLVKLGANPTKRDKDGNSALMYQVQLSGYGLVAEFLYKDKLAISIYKESRKVSLEWFLSEMSYYDRFEAIKKVLKDKSNDEIPDIVIKSLREVNIWRNLEPPLPWAKLNVWGTYDDGEISNVITRYSEIDDYPYSNNAREIYVLRTDDMKDQMLRGFSLNLTSDIVTIVRDMTALPERQPYNLSMDSFEDDDRRFFRYGSDTVVSIYKDADGAHQVSHLKATAPICAGEGRVIYTKVTSDGTSRVYENSIDLKGDEKELCHSLSSRYEKNWVVSGATARDHSIDISLCTAYSLFE